MINCIQFKNHPFKNHIAYNVNIGSFYYTYLNTLNDRDCDRCTKTAQIYRAFQSCLPLPTKDITITYSEELHSVMFKINENN